LYNSKILETELRGYSAKNRAFALLELKHNEYISNVYISFGTKNDKQYI
jgi:hypothetical protein